MPSRRYQGTPAIAVAIALLPALLPSPLLRCRFCRRATPERREAIPTVFYLDWRLALASYSLPVAAVEIFLNNWMLLVSCWRPSDGNDLLIVGSVKSVCHPGLLVVVITHSPARWNWCRLYG